MTTSSPSLADVLASSLPAGLNLTYYHISTPPTSCAAIYAPPPGLKPERTYSESHSLLVTTKTSPSPDDSSTEDEEVAIYAIELILYTTTYLSTLFVSKADSTGYASLLTSDRAAGAGSIIRDITSTFIAWLIKHRARSDRRLVLSLFARAQGQYLFPGSVENGKKHVLDDRQLVKWWCKTLDPVVRAYACNAATTSPGPDRTKDNANSSTEPILSAKAYLIVPGHDHHETSFFFPFSARSDPPDSKRWNNAHPLTLISEHPNAPPRCLIPQFPDDPKARFLLELDEEIPDVALSQSSRGADGKVKSKSFETTSTSPTKRGKGMWKSVKTLEQFWEMMAFRQECSSGRLVGFLWVVFTPDGLGVKAEDLGAAAAAAADQESQEREEDQGRLKRKSSDVDSEDTRAPNGKRCNSHHNHTKHKPRLTGPIHPRAPRIKVTSSSSDPIATSSPASSFQSSSLSFSSSSASETTKYYHAPLTSRGTLVLPQKEYDRVHEILLRLDFSSLRKSKESTGKWVEEAGVIGGYAIGVEGVGGGSWGVGIVGRGEGRGAGAGAAEGEGGRGKVNVLSVKKRTKDAAAASPATGNAGSDQAAANGSVVGITTLNSTLVRKKPKVEAAVPQIPQGVSSSGGGGGGGVAGSGVNVLSASLVRKKPKA